MFFSGARKKQTSREFFVTISNYGKTPVQVGTVASGLRPLSDIPRTLPANLDDFFDSKGFRGYALGPETEREKPFISWHDKHEWNRAAYNAIFGRIWYRDIFGDYRSSGFLLEIFDDGDTRAIPGYDTYWEERNESDFGPARPT